jgi:phage major head subunit gpT-like protein
MFEKKEADNVKVDRETATADFEKFCSEWRIGYDTATMTEDDQAEFEKLKQQIVTAVMDGRLYYDTDESWNYTISGSMSKDLVGTQIDIHRPKGDAYMEMDRFKDGQNMRKMYAILGYMISKPVQYISRLDGIDLKIIQAVQNLFLAG